MLHRTIPLLFFLFLGFCSSAQINKYYSISGSANLAMIDMNLYRAATHIPPAWTVGGSVAYGFSIREEFNMSIGLDILSYKPNNTRGYYEKCQYEDIDISCLPTVKTTQFYLPIGFEFYSNTLYKSFHSFVIFSLIPSVSLTENIKMTVYDKTLAEIDSYYEKGSAFKFQDFCVAASISNDFTISPKYKFFVEPGMRLSLLFRTENFVNPNTMVTLKAGIRFRGEKEK